jgi:hypothetical protein
VHERVRTAAAGLVVCRHRRLESRRHLHSRYYIRPPSALSRIRPPPRRLR